MSRSSHIGDLIYRSISNALLKNRTQASPQNKRPLKMRRLQLQENRSATILAPVRVTQFWAWSDWWIWHVCWIIVLGVIWLLGKWCNVGNIIYAGCSTSYCLLSKPSKTKEQHEGGGYFCSILGSASLYQIFGQCRIKRQNSRRQVPWRRSIVGFNKRHSGGVFNVASMIEMLQNDYSPLVVSLKYYI